jgi:acyl-CoA thioester hydrolase
MSSDGPGNLRDPARLTVSRLVEWRDASYGPRRNWAIAFRAAESAEAALHTALGVVDVTFGAMERVSVTATFERELAFNERVEVDLRVCAVGRSSVAYEWSLRHGEDVVAAGRLESRCVDRTSRRPASWPEHVRERLAGAGRQRPTA